jgi:hypothetical protein
MKPDLHRCSVHNLTNSFFLSFPAGMTK